MTELITRRKLPGFSPSKKAGFKTGYGEKT
jgi:hypothetical protein